MNRFYSQKLQLLAVAFDGWLYDEDIPRVMLNVPRLRSAIADADDVGEWRHLSVAQAEDLWPNLAIGERVRLAFLHADVQLKHKIDGYEFVVKTPAYFDVLNAMLNAKGEAQAAEKLDVYKILLVSKQNRLQLCCTKKRVFSCTRRLLNMQIIWASCHRWLQFESAFIRQLAEAAVWQFQTIHNFTTLRSNAL